MRKTYYVFLLLCIVSCRGRGMSCLYGETLFVTTDTYSKSEKYTTNYQIEFKKGSVIERVLVDNKIVFDAESAQVKHFSFGANTDPGHFEVTWDDGNLSVSRGPKGNSADNFSITLQGDKKNAGKSLFDIPDDIVLAQMLNFGILDKHRYRYRDNNLIAYTVSEGGCDYVLHYYIINDCIDVYRSEYQGANYNSYGGFRIDGKTARISGCTELYTRNSIVDFINRCIVYNFDLYVILYPFISMPKPIVSEINTWRYSASSELRERNIVYGASNMKELGGLPWASANGYGIGDKIKIDFGKAVPQTIYVMNGFVDSNRADLFLKNSRVKKIKLTNIKTGSWKVVGVYGDGAALSQIDVRSLAFTEDANILEIEILEVYPGTKYNDLCLQTIIPCFTDTVTCGYD